MIAVDDGRHVEPVSSTGHVSSLLACELAGCTYRQLDYWCRTGRALPHWPNTGSGSRRRFSVDEVARLRLVVRLLDFGFSLDVADRLVRSVSMLDQSVSVVFDSMLTVTVSPAAALLDVRQAMIVLDVQARAS